MNIIVCVDKSGGMMFNNRRVSQDREVISKVIDLTADARLLMSEYSAKLFEEHTDIMVSDDCLLQAEAGDFCFVEDKEIPLEKVECVYVFNWNRDYPADKYFSFDLKENGFKRIKKEEFAGNSHKKITLEIFRRA